MCHIGCDSRIVSAQGHALFGLVSLFCPQIKLTGLLAKGLG